MTLALLAGLSIIPSAQERPFVLSEAQMSRITAGGIISDAASAAAAFGSVPLTRTDAVAAVDPVSGHAEAQGMSSGPEGSAGSAATRLMDAEHRLLTTAEAQGVSYDAAPTGVSAQGRADVAPNYYHGGSAAQAHAGETHVNSMTGSMLESPDGSILGASVTNGFSGSSAPSSSASDVEAQVAPGNLSHRTRSASAGDTLSVASSAATGDIEKHGYQMQSAITATTASDHLSGGEASHVIISNENGVFVRLTGRAHSIGTPLVEPSASSGITLDGAGGEVFTTDRAARRAGEASSSTILLISPAP